ncbi:MAG: nuclear transport factor 2 family protein [Betaproteobacteria bacterium]|nr:nuclear transport factor 2 family protein [Betaproteobacteria bacterium]
MKRWLLLCLFAGCAAIAQAPSPTPEAVVRANSAAFNAQDVQALVATVAEDFVWFNVEGEKAEVQTRGRAALATGMAGYFKSLPSARSEIESLTVNGAFVSVKERARWKNKAGEDRSQAALAVYEVRAGLIQRVWYFPTQKP